jgi:16S rRNA (guanine527-N7)-methyltransferase
MKNPAYLKENLKKIIPTISGHQIILLEKYVSSLGEWNQRYNLISRKDIDAIWEHHIFPSLIPLSLIDFDINCWMLDIGSGGGLPVIPIKIVRPDLQILLVDSVRKKALFLQKIISDLDLKDITVKRERVEALQTNPILLNKFNVVTARAVANIPQLINWGKPFLKNVGFHLLWKGFSDINELMAIVKKQPLNYEIFSVPGKLKNLSNKFEDLRFFKIWF